MDTISSAEYGRRLESVLRLMEKAPCDALLIYNAEKEDPALLPWIIGNYIFDTTYLLLKRTGSFLFLPQWRIEEAKQDFTKVPVQIVGTGEKAVMAPAIAPYLSDAATVGFAGNMPYKEALLLGKKALINVEPELRRLMEIKTPAEIDLMKKARRITLEFLDSIDWTVQTGQSEKEIARRIEDNVREAGYPIAHLCLTAGERLQETTAGLPTDYMLKEDDLVCIDFGLGCATYYSDITRCYFSGRAKKYELDYSRLQQVVTKTAEQLHAGSASGEILNIFKKEFDTAGLGGNFVPADLGHGIGTGNHEYPEIGFDDSILRAGMVFTLEPEIRLQDKTRLRYEDMFYIAPDGRCRRLE